MTDGINGNHNVKLLLTNARSLSPKILSLQTYFEEHDLDVALVTESWLKDGQVLNRDIIDLEYGTDLKIVYKNRPNNRAGRRKVGGGVSIIYKKSRCSFKERKIQGNKFELVLAVGKIGTIARQVAIFCVYIEPRMKIAELAELGDLISREILQLKAKGDPLILLGGDLNRRDLSNSLADFPDMKAINHEPTRGDACLDVLFSNLQELSPRNWPPLETPDGIKSDHVCVVFKGHIKKERDFHWVRKRVRKFTQAAVEEYGRRLANAEWDRVVPPHLEPDEMIERFQSWAAQTTDELFPWKTARCRSNEQPWITDGIRRLAKRKNRVYKRERKSRLWH